MFSMKSRSKLLLILGYLMLAALLVFILIDARLSLP